MYIRLEPVYAVRFRKDWYLVTNPQQKVYRIPIKQIFNTKLQCIYLCETLVCNFSLKFSRFLENRNDSGSKVQKTRPKNRLSESSDKNALRLVLP